MTKHRNRHEKGRFTERIKTGKENDTVASQRKREQRDHPQRRLVQNIPAMCAVGDMHADFPDEFRHRQLHDSCKQHNNRGGLKESPILPGINSLYRPFCSAALTLYPLDFILLTHK